MLSTFRTRLWLGKLLQLVDPTHGTNRHHELDPPPELPLLELEELDDEDDEDDEDDDHELPLDEPQELLFPDDRCVAMYMTNPSPLPLDLYTK